MLTHPELNNIPFTFLEVLMSCRPPLGRFGASRRQLSLFYQIFLLELHPQGLNAHVRHVTPIPNGNPKPHCDTSLTRHPKSYIIVLWGRRPYEGHNPIHGGRLSLWGQRPMLDISRHMHPSYLKVFVTHSAVELVHISFLARICPLHSIQ